MNTQSVLPTPSPAQPLMTAGTFANLYGDDAPLAGTPAAIAPATTRRTETVRAARPCTAGQSEAAHGQPEEHRSANALPHPGYRRSAAAGR